MSTTSSSTKPQRRASASTASMLRDIQAGRATEGQHILGDMLNRAQAAAIATPLLALAHLHVQAYEKQRG